MYIDALRLYQFYSYQVIIMHMSVWFDEINNFNFHPHRYIFMGGGGGEELKIVMTNLCYQYNFVNYTILM